VAHQQDKFRIIKQCSGMAAIDCSHQFDVDHFTGMITSTASNIAINFHDHICWPGLMLSALRALFSLYYAIVRSAI
jgi:hypothetical protein